MWIVKFSSILHSALPSRSKWLRMSWVNTHRMTQTVTRMQRECTINAQWRDAGRINCKSLPSLFSLPLFSSLQCAVLWSVGAPVIGIETWLAVKDNDVDGATTRSANRAVLHRFCIGFALAALAAIMLAFLSLCVSFCMYSLNSFSADSLLRVCAPEW